MPRLFDRFEETAFRRIETGYIYQDSPWLIGPRRHYLVSEAEKDGIATCVRQTSRDLKPFVYGAGILIPIVIATCLWIMLDHAPADLTDSPSFSIMILFALLIFGVFAPFAILVHAYGRQRLKPLVAGLRPSDRGITWRDGLESFATTVSSRFLALMVMCGALPCIGPAVQIGDAFLEHRPIPNPPIIVLQLTMSGIVTMFFLYLLIIRAKSARAPR